MKKLTTIFLILLLTLTMASAAFELSVESVKDRIKQGDTAEVKLTLTNTGSAAALFQLEKPAKWRLKSEPLSDYFSGISVAAGESKTTNLFMTPESDLMIGVYAVDLKITESATNETQTVSPRIYVESGEKVDYVPNLQVPVRKITNAGKDSTEINPQEPITIMLMIENQNSLDIPDYTIKLDGGSLIKEEATSKIGPYGNDTQSWTVKIDDYVPPQKIDLRITLLRGGEIIKEFIEPITIGKVDKDLQQSTATEKKFLSKITTINITNLGNVEKTGEITLKTSWINRMFSSTKPEADVKTIDDSKYYAWEVTLQPSQSTTLQRKTSYVSLAIIIIILIAIWIFFAFINPEVVIKKRIVNVSRSEGGVSEIKLLLLVKNMSNKNIRNLRVLDIIPNIAAFIKEDLPGTIPPKKIRAFVSGTEIEWGIPEIYRNEERIIRYKIRTKLSILGDVRLPNAEVSYELPNGRRKTSYSDKGVVKKE